MSLPGFDPLSIIASLAKIGLEAAMEYHATRQAIGEDAARKRFLAKCRTEVAIALADEEAIAEARRKSDEESVAIRERIAAAEAALSELNVTVAVFPEGAAAVHDGRHRTSREDEPPDVMDADRAAALTTPVTPVEP